MGRDAVLDLLANGVGGVLALDVKDMSALFLESGKPMGERGFNVSPRWADDEFGGDVFDVNAPVFDGARFENVGVDNEEVDLVLDEGVANDIVGANVFACGQDGGVVDKQGFGRNVGAIEVFI